MITDPQTARELAKKVIDTGNKGFLMVVFPFPEDEEEPMLSMNDLDIVTNANNGLVIYVAMLAAMMLKMGGYRQEILQGERQLPES